MPNERVDQLAKNYNCEFYIHQQMTRARHIKEKLDNNEICTGKLNAK